MATGLVRMPPGTVVFITPNGASVTQEGQGVPNTIMQPPGMVQYVGQQLGSPSLGPPQIPQMGLLEKLRKLETKTLGAIQIMMGLIHVGLGGVSLYIFNGPYAGIAGYPIWGGAFFILSGSLSVSAENCLKIDMKVSTGLCVLLLMFSKLEFCITVSIACFGLSLTRHHNEPAPVFIPYIVSEDPMAPSPPSYDSAVSSLK